MRSIISTLLQASFFLTLLLSSSLSAQIVEAWSVNISGSSHVNDSGDVYVMRAANGDAVITRIRADGTTHWTRTWDIGTQYVEHSGIDNLGNAYMQVRTYSVTSGNQIVILCYDSLGTLVWEDWPNPPGISTYDDHVHGMAVNTEGHVALSGHTLVAEGQCESSEYGVFVIGYGPSGPGSRWIQSIAQSNYTYNNDMVAVSPTGTVLVPILHRDPTECLVPGNCDSLIEGCELTRNYTIHEYNSSGSFQNATGESLDTRIKYFDDGSFCIWQIPYYTEPSYNLRYYTSSGVLDWVASSYLHVLQPYKDSYGNIYVIAAYQGPDTRLNKSQSPNVTDYHIIKYSPSGSVLAERSYAAAYRIYGGAVLPDGRFFAVFNIYSDNETFNLKMFDPDLNEQDDFLLANGYDFHFMKGTDAYKNVYVQSNSRVIKFQTTKTLIVKDVNGDEIENTEFNLIRVADDVPEFTEDTLGVVETDLNGEILLVPASGNQWEVTTTAGTALIEVGDRLKISKHLFSESSARHFYSLQTMYSVHLDNAKFDDLGVVTFDNLSGDDEQEIILDHTELRYSLMVSVEWDADQDYLYGLQADLKAMSNYLYDITDGQVRLDTITIYDNKYRWTIADVKILATNMHRPNSGINIYSTTAYPIHMPRKWFSARSLNRDSTYENHPFAAGTPQNYRTIAHELGHFAFGFLDEYDFMDTAGTVLPDAARYQPLPAGNYGFMDWQYQTPLGGVYASEMSSSYRYADLNSRNTEHYILNFMSCWDYFEARFEGTYDGIYAPIRKPDIANENERLTPAGLEYFPGPNNDLLNLNYDVGSKIVFTENVVAPATHVASHRVLVDGVPAGGVNVKLDIDDGTGFQYRTIDQGNTTDLGLIWVLGVNPFFDVVTASGNTWEYISGAAEKAFSLAAVQRQWLYGQSNFGAGDTTYITLAPVQGNYPLIFDAMVDSISCELEMFQGQSFNEPPEIALIANDTIIIHSTSSTGAGYASDIGDSIGTSGILRLLAVDEGNNPFAVDLEYTVANDTGGHFTKVIGPQGSIVVSVDPINSGLDKMMLLSSPYPVVRTGLDPNAVQAGQAQSVSLQPPIDLIGVNNLSINYSDDDLKINDNLTGNEADLQIYYWNDIQLQWELLGGIVDTLLNKVTSPFTDRGVYAAFTTNIVTGVDDEHGDVLPYRFKLSQNYPNPFNPVTTIEYSLPERSHVTIEVYNVLGQKVRTLVDREESAGDYSITWDSRSASDESVSTGVYFYRFQADDHVETKKMLLLK